MSQITPSPMLLLAAHISVGLFLAGASWFPHHEELESILTVELKKNRLGSRWRPVVRFVLAAMDFAIHALFWPLLVYRSVRNYVREGDPMNTRTAREKAADAKWAISVEQPGGHTILEAGSRVYIHERDPQTGEVVRKRRAWVKYTGDGGPRAELVVCPDEPAL